MWLLFAAGFHTCTHTHTHTHTHTCKSYPWADRSHRADVSWLQLVASVCMAKLTDVVWCVFRQWKDCWNTTSLQPSPRTNKSFSCASENAISWFSRDLLTLALSAPAGPRKRLQGNATRSPFNPHCHCHCPPLSPLLSLIHI